MKRISSQGYIFSKCGHDEMRTVSTYLSVHIGRLSIYFLPLNNIASLYFIFFLLLGILSGLRILVKSQFVVSQNYIWD